MPLIRCSDVGLIMKVCVVGAGALGCTIGGTLAEGGNEVYFVDANKAHVDAINASGLIMNKAGEDRVVKITAATDVSGIGVVDLVIVLVKSFHTRKAIEAARNIIGEETVVMSLQNGLGNEEMIGEVVGQDRVISGKTYVGGGITGPGRVIASTDGKLTYIGELDGSIGERVKRIAETFSKAGLQTNISDNIVGTIWDKLLINVATGAVTAISGLTYGELYATTELEAVSIAAIAEAMAVAAAKGVRLSITEPRQAWSMASDGLPPGFKTSMLQSLESGSVTEVDFINGSVVRAGRSSGIATPVNETLVACVKGIERRMARAVTQ